MQNELILDDGSGNGRFSIAIAKKGAEVISLDINRRILKTAAESFRKKQLNDKIEPILGDIQNLPFKDSAFDRVLCVHNLWYVPNYKTAIREMFRTLRNEGEVVTDHINLLNRRACIEELIFAAMKIFRRNPTPIFYRTPQQIIHAFASFRPEIFSLSFESKKDYSFRKGIGLWAPRLIIKCSKFSRQVSGKRIR